MKIKVLIGSLLLITAFVIYKLGKDGTKLTSLKEEGTTAVNKTSKEERRIMSKVEVIDKSSQAESKVNPLINEVIDVRISVFERTPKVLSLRQIKLSSADETKILDHLKKVDFRESESIKNDLIEHMVRYGRNQSQVGRTLLNIIKNPSQDRVIREYVLQYIPEFYLNRWNPGKEWDDAENQDRQLFNDALWEITDLTEGSMAGGALFALHRIADKYEDIDHQEVFKRAEKILIDPGYMNPNRMGAVQVLAFSNNEEYFETAKGIVLDQNQPVLLQVTAIHTATQSKFLDKDFISYLRHISNGGEGVHPSLQKCAKLTLLKIK